MLKESAFISIYVKGAALVTIITGAFAALDLGMTSIAVALGAVGLSSFAIVTYFNTSYYERMKHVSPKAPTKQIPFNCSKNG